MAIPIAYNIRNLWTRRLTTVLTISGMALVVFVFAMLCTGSFYLAAAIMMLLGASAAPVTISSNTMLHEIVREDMRGRIFSSMGVVMSVSLLVFMFLTSVLAEFVGKAAIIVGIGTIFIVCSGWGLIARSVKAGR